MKTRYQATVTLLGGSIEKLIVCPAHRQDLHTAVAIGAIKNVKYVFLPEASKAGDVDCDQCRRENERGS